MAGSSTVKGMENGAVSRAGAAADAGARAPSLSVALCTYNGARHLPQQLESLAAQTRPPDELVVCDDRSSDDTAALVTEFAARAPFPVRLRVNARNLGSTRNFEVAIRLCAGQVIALCDQDDVWLPQKLARIGAVFGARPEVGLVFSDGVVVDEALRPLGHGVWDSFGFTPRMRRRVRRGGAFDLLLGRNLVTGATMAFRAVYREAALPVPAGTDRIHDGWIALVVAALAPVALIEEPLILYRQHTAQQLGAGLPVEWEKPLGEKVRLARRAGAAGYRDQAAALERLRACLAEASAGSFPAAAALARVDAKLANLRARAAMPGRLSARVPRVARELLSGRYHRYAEGMLSAARDLLVGP